MDSPNPVALLPPEVSRRIAAGEVIERPASVVRELVDNSLDAGAGTIDISWTEGGSELIRVHDDGRGMSAADLELCWQPHATSKIRNIEDLEASRSLGFRGEALASVSAVSELTMRSAERESSVGRILTVRHGELEGIKPAPPTPGTTVEVRRLFANLPARRRFLSRPQAETQAIRNVILDKALPFPDVQFSHSSGTGSPQILGPQSQLERVAAVYGPKVPRESLYQLSGSAEGFSLQIIAAEPSIVRRDRKMIQIFVNRRRVWEYKLVQAVEYAYQDVQHGGLFPAAAVLIDIDPALVDFNIHPAKREVRLRNGGELHHRIVELLRSFLRSWTVQSVTFEGNLWPQHTGEALGGSPTEPLQHPSPIDLETRSAGHGPLTGPRAGTTGRSHPSGALSAGPVTPRDTARRTKAHFDHHTRAVPTPDQLVYRGTLFGTFLIVERGGTAWIIDQHAAHERLLYDRFTAARTSQQLLVPDEFEVSADQDQLLQRHRAEYQEIGIVLQRVAVGRWQVTAMPGEYRENSEDLIETILELGGLHDALDRTFIAEMACKAALKAGDYLDGITALELAERTLALSEPRCPHGRPLYIELTQDRLEHLIGRR
ncbi:MAG: DNA mismatch repair endonuclease MutL [Alkalispirochaeta sp.]